MITKIKVLTLAMVLCLFVGCSSDEVTSKEPAKSKSEVPEFTTNDNTSVFSIDENIPDKVIETMLGKSLPSREVASDLSFLTITYVNFDGDSQIGNLVVNKAVAKDVIDIFKEIYEAKFPIELMILVDAYDADDVKSMLANNTSAFNYRTIAGTTTISNHGKGLAIDINPLFNPHVVNGKTNPSEAQKYSDRSLDVPGMIKEGDVVYNAFIKRGWSWGGHWKNPDYQHFEKEIK